MAGGGFTSAIRLAMFLLAIWIGGKASKLAGISSLLAEIAIGVALGPKAAGLVPTAYAECPAKSIYNCDLYEEKSTDDYHVNSDASNHDGHTEKWIKICEDGGAHRRLSGDADTSDSMALNTAQAGYTCPTDNVILATYEGDVDAEHCDQQCLDSAACLAYVTDSFTSACTFCDHALEDTQGTSEAHTKTVASVDSSHGVEEKCVYEECEYYKDHECQESPGPLEFAGFIGVSLMIFESGMHVNFDKLASVIGRGCAVAIVGTFGPIGMGVLFASLLGFGNGGDFPMDGWSAGIAMAPTSVGIGLKLLMEEGMLDEDYGQAIICAAIVDDVLSLVLFGLLIAVNADGLSFSAFLPGILGFVFLGAVGYVAAKVFPNILKTMLEWVPTKVGKGLNPKDNVLIIIMFFMLFAFSTITSNLVMNGSHLWGCFAAGVMFAKDHHNIDVWQEQLKRLTCWTLRFFFACTVGFAIPINELLSFESFWKGMVMGAIPCVGMKLVSGFCMGLKSDDKWVVGWAMCGRAEFAYLIAQTAVASKAMSMPMFAVTTWALVCATILAPIFFKKALEKKRRAADALELDTHLAKGPSAGKSNSTRRPSRRDFAIEQKAGEGVNDFRVMIMTKYTVENGYKIVNELHQNELNVIGGEITNDKFEGQMCVFTVRFMGDPSDFTDSRLQSMHKRLSTDRRVVCFLPKLSTTLDASAMVRLSFAIPGHADMLKKVLEGISETKMHILQMNFEYHHKFEIAGLATYTEKAGTFIGAIVCAADPEVDMANIGARASQMMRTRSTSVGNLEEDDLKHVRGTVAVLDKDNEASKEFKAPSQHVSHDRIHHLCQSLTLKVGEVATKDDVYEAPIVAEFIDQANKDPLGHLLSTHLDISAVDKDVALLEITIIAPKEAVEYDFLHTLVTKGLYAGWEKIVVLRCDHMPDWDNSISVVVQSEEISKDPTQRNEIIKEARKSTLAAIEEAFSDQEDLKVTVSHIETSEYNGQHRTIDVADSAGTGSAGPTYADSATAVALEMVEDDEEAEEEDEEEDEEEEEEEETEEEDL